MSSKSLTGIQSFLRYAIPSLVLGLPIFGFCLVLIGSLILIVMSIMGSDKWSSVFSLITALLLLLGVHLMVNVFLFWVFWGVPRDGSSITALPLITAWVALFIASQIFLPAIERRM